MPLVPDIPKIGMNAIKHDKLAWDRTSQVVALLKAGRNHFKELARRIRTCADISHRVKRLVKTK